MPQSFTAADLLVTCAKIFTVLILFYSLDYFDL